MSTLSVSIICVEHGHDRMVVWYDTHEAKWLARCAECPGGTAALELASRGRMIASHIQPPTPILAARSTPESPGRDT